MITARVQFIAGGQTPVGPGIQRKEYGQVQFIAGGQTPVGPGIQRKANAEHI